MPKMVLPSGIGWRPASPLPESGRVSGRKKASMKTVSLAFALLFLGLLGAAPAQADRGHHHSHSHFSLIIDPFWGPWYYPPPRYYYPPYYPPVIVAPAPPPVYIEQGSAESAPQTNYWYYCNASQSYYPYVKDCPEGWLKVAPQPPATR